MARLTCSLLEILVCIACCHSLANAACDKTSWFHSVRTGNKDDVLRCIRSNTDVGLRDEAGCTALINAALNKHGDIVSLLVENGKASLEQQCLSGTTPLMAAAKVGDLSIVKYLHDQGADLEAEANEKGWTALTYAARHGHLSVARYLHKLDFEFGKDWTGTGLMWAAAVGDESMVRQLVQKGWTSHRQQKDGDLETRDEHGNTAVMWASQRGNVDSLKTLKSLGANLATTTHSGWTPLMAASFGGHRATMVYLMENGADVEATDKAGWTALMWAAANDQVGAIDVLVEEGRASLGPQEGDWNALMVAAAAGKFPTVKHMLKLGLSFKAVNHQRKTAEEIAAERGHTEVAELFARMRRVNEYERSRIHGHDSGEL